MLRRMRPHLSYSNVIATIALFCALGGSAYAAKKISGKTIINRTIEGKKVRLGTLGAKEINENSIAPKLPAVKRAALALDSGKLSGIPLASVVTARSANDKDDSCDPAGAGFIDCVSVALDLPHSGRVMLVGTGGFAIGSGPPPASGTCRLQVDGADVGGSAQRVGGDIADHYSLTANGFATTAVTGDLTAGIHTFALACNEDDPDALFVSTKISAILAGSS